MDEHEHARIDGWFSNEVVTIRDMLQPIADGTIERGHCPAGTREGLGGVPGKRKLTLKDARRIVGHVIVRINRAVNKFHEAKP